MANEYWIKREREKLKGHLNDVDKTEKILASNFKKASRDIEDEIYKIYSRYSIDNKISYAEANKLLTGDRYKAWRMDLVDYVKEIEETNNDELLLELNTLSAKSRITRLEENLYQIQKILDSDYRFKHKEVKDLLKTGVKNSFTQTAYTIDTLNGFHGNFSMINKEEIEGIINLPWSGKNYSKRLWNNRTKLKEKVQKQVVQACIQGKDLRDCIRDVSTTMGSSRGITKRLINTEHAYACAQGDLKMYSDLGVDRYEYVATLDMKTSDVCRGLDGKVFDVSEAVSGVNFPPMHPHCRSTTVPADIQMLGDETRIARDEDGNNIYLKNDTKYSDYQKALESGNWERLRVIKSIKPTKRVDINRILPKDIPIRVIDETDKDAVNKEIKRLEAHLRSLDTITDNYSDNYTDLDWENVETLSEKLEKELSRLKKITFNKIKKVIPVGNFEFIEARTIKEANAFAEKYLEVKCSFKGIDINVANDWNRGMFDMKKEFPDVAENIKFIGSVQERNKFLKRDIKEFISQKYIEQGRNINNPTIKRVLETECRNIYSRLGLTKVRSEVIAESYFVQPQDDFSKVLANYNGITVNTARGGDYEKMLEMLKENIESKFHSKRPPNVKGIFDHEFGHQIDKAYGVSKNKEIIDLRTSLSNKEITNGLSEYAWRNKNSNVCGEFIAEAWAEYKNSPEPREIATKVGHIIERMKK